MFAKLFKISNKNKMLTINSALIIYQELLKSPLDKEDRDFLLNKGYRYISGYLQRNKEYSINKIPLKTRSYKIKNTYSPDKLEMTINNFKEISNNIFNVLNINTNNSEFAWFQVSIQQSYYKSKKTNKDLSNYILEFYEKEKTSDIIVKNKILEFLKFNLN